MRYYYYYVVVVVIVVVNMMPLYLHKLIMNS